MAGIEKVEYGIQGVLDIVPCMLFNGGHLFGIDVLQLNIKSFGQTNTAFTEEHGTPIIFPDIFAQRTYFPVGPDGDQTDHLPLGQMRKWDVLIRNQGRVIQIGIHEILNLAIIKKIHAHDLVVLILNSDHDKRIVFGVAVGQGTNVL